MGATLTAVCVHGREAHVAEVGDSRAYLIRNGQILQITHDQSFVQALLDAGMIQPEEAERHPMRNNITAIVAEVHGEGLTPPRRGERPAQTLHTVTEFEPRKKT
ncbi:hypothetical protein WMF18_13455 [Sorangium sp. So ce315]|uniref:PP2C family protein-serine/threonine phosphatase n=1 Tax=Sorangium sp. So ce315 TaxID=3133299 RepID=UPI003F5F0670